MTVMYTFHMTHSFSFLIHIVLDDNEHVSILNKEIVKVISPDNYQAFKHNGNVTSLELDGSPLLQKAAIDLIFLFSSETSNYFTWIAKSSMKLPSYLFALLEWISAKRTFVAIPYNHHILASREYEQHLGIIKELELAILACLESMPRLECRNGLRRWVLFAQKIVAADFEQATPGDNMTYHQVDHSATTLVNTAVALASATARHSASQVLIHDGPSRWKVRLEATRIMILALTTVTDLNIFCD